MKFWEFIDKQSEDAKATWTIFIVVPLVAVFIWVVVKVMNHVL